MTRMMTSRSSRFLVAAAALSAAPLAGQDTAQVVPPADSLPRPERPARHVVRVGESLWSLAQLYLGDPLLWPEIYRLNTLVVEDPHWIFPGEELMLAQADQTAVARPDTVGAPPADTVVVELPVTEAPELTPPPPPPPAARTPTVFARRQAGPTGPGLADVSTALPHRAVRRGDFYASGFLTEQEDLPWARVLGPLEPSRGLARRGAASATRYEQVLIEAPEGASYHVGDSLLLATLSAEVRGGWGRIVAPTGIARVTHAAGRDVQAEIVIQFGRVADGQVAIPVEPFRDPGTTRPVPVAQGLMGTIITTRDGDLLPSPSTVLFIDHGRTDGIVVGDIFEVLQSPPDNAPAGAPPTPLALLQIVHVRDRSATGLLTHVYGAGIQRGVPVRLIRKMPS